LGFTTRLNQAVVKLLIWKDLIFQSTREHRAYGSGSEHVMSDTKSCCQK